MAGLVFLLSGGEEEAAPPKKKDGREPSKPYVSSPWLPIPDVTLPNRVRSQLDQIDEERSRNLEAQLEGVELESPCEGDR